MGFVKSFFVRCYVVSIILSSTLYGQSFGVPLFQKENMLGSFDHVAAEYSPFVADPIKTIEKSLVENLFPPIFSPQFSEKLKQAIKADVKKEEAVPVIIKPGPGSSGFLEKSFFIGESRTEQALPNYAYLGQFLNPWEYLPPDRFIEINFENAELINLIRYFEQQYGLSLVLDDIIKPPEPGARQIAGVKFTFKTERALNRKEAWNVFLKFLDMAGLMVIPGPVERMFLVTNSARNSAFSTARDPVPLFIGIDYGMLPDSDIRIRYIYFIQNTTPNVIKTVADNLKSTIAGTPIIIEDLNALILTDKASNIRSILAILKELDKPILPETLTIIKLINADATKVKALYDSLVKEESSLLARLSPGGRKQSTIAYFTENVRVIADPRTNSLVLLGPRVNVEKIEQFIRREVDRDIDLPYSPLHVYPLKYIDAEATAQIINELKGFQPESAIGATQFGGVIGGIKFLKPTVTVTAEKSTNSLIVNAEYDDYLQIYDLLEKIDTEQPQVAIRTLVLNITWANTRSLGIQFRNAIPQLNGVLGADTPANAATGLPGINFQTSGLPFNGAFAGLQLNPKGPGSQRLLANLVSLASANVPGSTVVTLGADAFGVWGIFKILSSISNVSVVAKPFLITTHKYRAQITIEEVRHVVTSTIQGGNTQPVSTFGDLTAGLTLEITPQISPDGLVTLVVSVRSSAFTTLAQNSSNPSTDPAQGNRNEKRIDTSVIVEDNQVLALGGITQDVVTETEFKVPILGDVPILGWFFKSKRKDQAKSSLLVLISAEIINPHSRRRIEAFTNTQMTEAHDLLDKMTCDEQLKDPVNTWFFGDKRDPIADRMRAFNTNPSAEKVARAQRRGRRSVRRRAPPEGAMPPEPPLPPVRRSRGRRSVRGQEEPPLGPQGPGGFIEKGEMMAMPMPPPGIPPGELPMLSAAEQGFIEPPPNGYPPPRPMVPQAGKESIAEVTNGPEVFNFLAQQPPPPTAYGPALSDFVDGD